MERLDKRDHLSSLRRVGRRPLPALGLSAICFGLLVPRMTAVTAWLPRRYLTKNCAQLVASKSLAHSGSGRPGTARKRLSRP